MPEAVRAEMPDPGGLRVLDQAVTEAVDVGEPAAAPTYSRMTRNRSTGLAFLFVGGYLFTWAAAGLAVYRAATSHRRRRCSSCLF
jgi:hypothetical protein